MSDPFYDKKGFPICIGDLLRVPHFVGVRGRIHYMWRVAIEVSDRKKGLVAMCLKELVTLGKEKAHICDMSLVGEGVEIVSGSGGYGLEDWEDFRLRPKRKI